MKLSNKQRQEVREVFEKRYGRKLADDEIEKIALNLTNYMEVLLKPF